MLGFLGVICYNYGMQNQTVNAENLLLKQQVSLLQIQLSEKDNALKNKEETLKSKDTLMAKKDHTISVLEEYIRYMKQQRFGSSSEKLSSAQLNLFDEAELLADDEVTDEEETTTTTKKRKKKRPSIPEHLPCTEVIYDLEDTEKFCPHDGTALKHFGEESSKQLDYIPAQIKVIKHIRKKYVCPCCNKHIVTAKKPAQPIEKSIASANLLAQIATLKYCDAQPLYRQTFSFKRLGIELDSTSLANWMIKCGQLVQPLINLMYEKVRESELIYMDETVLQVLKEVDRTAKQQSRMWVMANDNIVIFNYSATRSAEVALTMLDDFNGTLMTDGYGAYDKVARINGLNLLACWAHARRYFKEAKDVQPKGTTGKADKALSLIAKLFIVERKLKTATTEEKYKARQEESIPILNELRQWLDKSLLHSVKSSKLSKALTYLDNQWKKLSRYTENGAWPIDNNHAENTIRPLVVGRKNWLFAATAKGANASANLYSLIETAKANNIEPSEYLRIIFTKLPQAKSVEDIEALLPWNINTVVG